MKAVAFHEHGGIENYELIDAERPTIEPDEVLLDVKASALNYMDLFAVYQLDNYVPSYPFWGGGDVAGTIDEVGDAVQDWSVGDRIVVNPFISCGHCDRCVRGDAIFCENFRMLGEMRKGGHAEYVAVPARNVIPIPDGVPFTTAASVPVAGGTAWRALVSRGQIKPYEDVLIVGATGGVGTFAVQIAKSVFGVDTLYGTTSTDEKAEFLSGLGVDHVVDYTETAFDREMWELTDKQGVDVVYNCVGGETWTQAMRTLRYGGRLITSGATVDPNPETELRQIFIRQLDVIGSSGANPYDLDRLFEYVWDGTIEPVVQETYPLEEYMTAFEKMEDRELYGKVLLVQE